MDPVPDELDYLLGAPTPPRPSIRMHQFTRNNGTHFEVPETIVKWMLEYQRHGLPAEDAWAKVARRPRMLKWAKENGHGNKIARSQAGNHTRLLYDELRQDPKYGGLLPTIGESPSEEGVATVFADLFGDYFRFCKAIGIWFHWTGSHWQRDAKNFVFECIRKTCDAQNTLDPISPPYKAMKKSSFMRGVESIARSDPQFSTGIEDWDRDNWLLGTPGGTVDLHTGELRPADPGDMISRLTTATPSAVRPVRWLAFLNDALAGDAEAIRFFQQWAGYALTGDTREEALLFVHGPGGSGKSTAINTLADVMGEYAIHVESATLTASKWARHTTEIARLNGARFAYASETEAGSEWAESRIKELTGRDKLTARFMRCDDTTFTPRFKLTIVGNHAPRIASVDSAMRRRFNVLPFEHRPSRVDTALKEALLTEAPAILAWAIEGCVDWQHNGLVRPDAVTAATNAYFESQDTFKQWLDECCEVGKGFVEPVSELAASFRYFLHEAGEMTSPTSKSFSQQLRSHGFTPIKDSHGLRGQRGFLGLKLRNAHIDEF